MWLSMRAALQTSCPQKGVKGNSPCTPSCLQGVVCYTQQIRKEYLGDTVFRWTTVLTTIFEVVGEIKSAAVLGTLISTQQSSVGRLTAALCGQSFIRSVLPYLMRCINPNEHAGCYLLTTYTY